MSETLEWLPSRLAAGLDTLTRLRAGVELWTNENPTEATVSDLLVNPERDEEFLAYALLARALRRAGGDEKGEFANALTLRLLESFPVQPQLPDDVTQGTHLEVFAAPVWHWSNLPRDRIVPLTVRTATSSRQFLAPQPVQLTGNFSVPHAATAVSIQKGVWKSSATRSSTGGRGRSRSWYASMMAMSASFTLSSASAMVSPSVISSGRIGQVTV